MNRQILCEAIGCISRKITENKQYLIDLDAKFGDGDLGISMSNGFEAVYDFLQETEETDMGTVLLKCATVFNKTSPSSLGTILSFGFMGAARHCKGKTELTLQDTAEAMDKALEHMMNKAQSQPGEKTILDAIAPAVEALKLHAGNGEPAATDMPDGERAEAPPAAKPTANKREALAYQAAYEAAEQGMLSTKDMLAVHGRAAYYGDKVIGHIDGGAVVGKLIFEGLRDYYAG
jgi:dihydroxyacetone kinase-like protein